MASDRLKIGKEEERLKKQQQRRERQMALKFQEQLEKASNHEERMAMIAKKEEKDAKRVERKAKKDAKPEINCAWKVRIRPTKKQERVLKKWFGTVRWVYNKSVEVINKQLEKGERLTETERARFIRNYCVGEGSVLARENAWLTEVPYDVRDDGRKHAMEALKSNLAKSHKRAANGEDRHHFKLSFRSKRDSTETLVVEARHWKHKKGVYYNLFGTSFDKMRVGMSKTKHRLRNNPDAKVFRLPDVLEHDARIVYNRHPREYHLCLPMHREVVGDSQAPDQNLDSVASLDPGVRTFMTVYSADGEVVEWGGKKAQDGTRGRGGGDTARIHRLCLSLDRLHSRMTQEDVRHKQRYNMKRAAARLRKRIRSVVDEVHHKLSKWLCQNFRVIIIPQFDTQNMVGRSTRRIQSKTARQMCTWAHYRFRQRLVAKSRRYPWAKVVITSEEFTSKACGWCGELNSSLGSSKTFLCKCCGVKADRDFNGARNILLKYLTSEVDPEVKRKESSFPSGELGVGLLGLVQ